MRPCLTTRPPPAASPPASPRRGTDALVHYETFEEQGFTLVAEPPGISVGQVLLGVLPWLFFIAFSVVGALFIINIVIAFILEAFIIQWELNEARARP